MSNLPASLLVPHAPQVNLIPPEVASRRAAGRARGFVIVALVLFVAVLAVASYWADTQRRDAVAQRIAAEEVAVALQAKIDKYAEVPLVQAQLQNALSARLFAGATELRWKVLLERMQAEIPAGVDISSAGFSVTNPFGAIAPIEGPYAAPGIGTLTFTAESQTYLDAAELERALNRVVGLTDTVIPSVTGNIADAVTTFTFSGTATVTAQALDLRFTDAWFQARDREVAGDYLDELKDRSDSEVAFQRLWDEDPEFRQAALDAGIPDAGSTLQAALDMQESVSEWRDAFTSLSEALTTAEANLGIATTALENGEEGAEALVEEAQLAVDTLAPVLDDLTAEVLALKSANEAVDTATTRVAAAETLVAAKKAQLVAANAALAAAESGRDELQADVDYYEILVSEAEAVLAKEEAAATAADEAADAARTSLTLATVTAEFAVMDASVESARRSPGVAPAGEPSASPSPSPSASQGGNS